MSLPSLVMVGRSFPLRVLVTVTSGVVAIGVAGGIVAEALRISG